MKAPDAEQSEEIETERLSKDNDVADWPHKLELLGKMIFHLTYAVGVKDSDFEDVCFAMEW
jgi:hypothetical protein